MRQEASEKPGEEPVAGMTAKGSLARRLGKSFWPLTILVVLIVSLLAGLVVDWLLPLSDAVSLENPRRIQRYPEYAAVEKSLRASLLPAKNAHVNVVVRDVGTHPITPLLSVEFLLNGKTRNGEIEVGFDQAHLRLRLDRLTFMVAVLLGLLLLWPVLYLLARPPEPEGRLSLTAGADLETLLRSEIERLGRDCERSDRRSKFLLAFGIMAAIGGLGAIYYLFPVQLLALPRDAKSDVSWLVKAFAIAILTIAEWVALYLLRLYLHETADYRYYSARRLREVRLLAALKLFSPSALPYEKEALLASALLDEDLFRSLTTGARDSEDGAAQLEKVVAAVERLGRKGTDGPRSSP